MKTLPAIVFAVLAGSALHAQQNNAAVPSAQPFGVIDKSDLEMTACDFEKDANAEILFDKEAVSFTNDYQRITERHIRVKIFNDNGKDEANVKLRFIEGNRSEIISDIEAETFNLENGAVEVTKVDKKQIFEQRVNKLITEKVFSFPDVKPGSVIEYKYTVLSPSLIMPTWFFQAGVPTRYSEFSAQIPPILYYKSFLTVNQPLAKNTPDVKALANIPAFYDEPFMGSRKDNMERIVYQLTGINSGPRSKSFASTWPDIAKELLEHDYFGGQFKPKLTGEEELISRAKALHTDAEKIAFLFGEVQKQMKWNNENVWFTVNGTQDAWNQKTGNSTEINLILYHLLRKCGLTAYPMLVSTKSNGKVYPAYPNKNQFNKTVTYVPVDSAVYYVLDASNKYNTCNDIPRNLLNSFGFYIDPDGERSDMVFLQKTNPALQQVSINADIAPGGKISGTAEINSYSYHRIDALERFDADGEKKYASYLRDKDNNLKVIRVKFENADTDTLPLKQVVTFDLTPAVPDDNYIYFTPNLFTRLKTNPFLSEKRLTDIDLEYRKDYLINGVYKMPAGYKTDVLPKNVSLVMPDKSISLKRVIAEQDGSIIVSYRIDFKKSIYFKEDYPVIHEFFKKMYEMLNEQIVLKKS
jgi:hypothetical protein